MFLTNKLISNSRYLLRKNTLQFRNTGQPARNGHVVAIPPRTKVPKGEFFMMSMLLTVSMWGIPFWVLYYLPEYQGEDRNQYTGK